MQSPISKDKGLIGMLLQIGTRRNPIGEFLLHRSLGQLPSILRVPSEKIPRSSQVRPEARVSPCAPSPVSSRVLSIVSRLTPRLVSRLVSRNHVNPRKSPTKATR